MEDLRTQIQDQKIATVGDLSLWTISLSKQDLFNETSARSMYFLKLNSKEPVTSDSPAILDDDRILFNIYLENAVKGLLVVLARRIPQSVYDFKELFDDGVTSAVYNDSTMFEVSLVMSANHDANLLPSLRVTCKEYLVKKTLEQWFNADFGSEVEKSNINHLLQYRRSSVARRVRSLL